MANVTFSIILEKHTDNVKQVLNLEQCAEAVLKLKESTLFTDNIDYLRHVVRPRRLEISTHTADAITTLTLPRNITNLCSSQRLCNVFRRFVHSFVPILAPLNRKLQEGQPNEFSLLHEEEFTAMTTFQ